MKNIQLNSYWALNKQLSLKIMEAILSLKARHNITAVRITRVKIIIKVVMNKR